MVKVCLDAGHYGKYNQSPAIKSYYESDMVWKLTELQKKYLEEYGIEVITTRSDKEKDLELHLRGKKAKGCDLFISNHSNAVGSTVNESIDYVAVYHLVDDYTTNVDDISVEISNKLAPVIAEVMGVKQGSRVLSRKSSRDRNGDGIMNDNYYGVLHGARMVDAPGIILEHSFHTNTKATKWLMDDGNLERLAKAEADVIAEYFGLTIEKKLLEVDGKWGKDTTKASQKLFGTVVDGIVSHQNIFNQQFVPNAKTASWEFEEREAAKKGSKFVKALQTFLAENGYYKSSIDGWFGKGTVTAMQQFLADRTYYKGKIDGIMGEKTVKAWQEYINDRM